MDSRSSSEILDGTFFIWGVRFGDSLSKEDIIRKVEEVTHQGGTKDLALLLDIIARDVFDKGSADRTLVNVK